MSTRKCANLRFERHVESVRSLRLGSLFARITTSSEFCIGEATAVDLARERELALASPIAELVANVQVKSSGGLSVLNGDDFYCSVPDSLPGLFVGDQVRVTRNASQYALYSIALRRIADNPNRVRMGQGGRQRLGTSDEFA